MAGYIGAASELGERPWAAGVAMAMVYRGVAPVPNPREPMSRSDEQARKLMAGVIALLALAVIACPVLAQKRPVVGVLSPFVDADSTFLTDLREGLAARGLHDGQ